MAYIGARRNIISSLRSSVASLLAVFAPVTNDWDLTNSNRTVNRRNFNPSTWRNTRGNIGKSTEKGYFEVTLGVTASTSTSQVGVANALASITDVLGSDVNAVALSNGAGIYTGGVTTTTATGNWALTAGGDVIMVAYDNGLVWFGRNGVWHGNPAAGTLGTAVTGAKPFFPAVSVFGIATPYLAFTLNTGQVPFAYTPPAGFEAGWSA